MDAWLSNIRYAIRVLARTPGFTLTVIATLAVVIGANTAVFSLVDAVLLKPLPFPDPDRLVLLSESRRGAPISNTAPVRLEEWNEASSTFEAITGYYTEDVSETSGDLPEQFRLARVAPRFHQVWGVAPALGRGLTAADNREAAAPVALVSHRFWVDYLDGDPDVLQRQVRLTDGVYSIVGVMPPDFHFPDRDVDIWVPRIYLPFMTQRTLLWYAAYGRLRPGITIEQARADLAAVQARLGEQFPETDREVGVYMEPLKDSVVGSVRGSLWIVFGAVSVLVLIAATNVTALLLAGSGLLIRSLVELSRVEPGFDASHVLSFRLSGSYQDFEFLEARVAEILDELAQLPGVEAAAMSAPVPGVLDDGSGFQFGRREWEQLEGSPVQAPQLASDFRVVSPSYYATMQIPVVAGSLCRMPAEGTVPEVMVNRAFATRYSPATSIVGRTLYGSGDVTYRIAGVVGDAREYGLARAPTPTVYWCRTRYVNPATAFLVRTRGDPESVVATVRAKAKELTPLRAVYDVAPLAQRMGDEHAGDRVRTTALTVFASVALSLAMLGVYGTLSYVVSLRRREVGLRVALGAQQRRIVAGLIGKALRVVGIACAVGVALSLALSKLLAGMLYGVSRVDPLSLGAVIALVGIVGTVAALMPALRAARVDPMHVLREE